MRPDFRETLRRMNCLRGECYCRSKSAHYIGKELSRTISPRTITTSLLFGDEPKVPFLPKRLRSADILSASGRSPLQSFASRISFVRKCSRCALRRTGCPRSCSALRLTRITTLGERGCLFPVALGDRIEDRLDLKRGQIRIGLHYQSDDADNIGARETVTG